MDFQLMQQQLLNHAEFERARAQQEMLLRGLQNSFPIPQAIVKPRPAPDESELLVLLTGE